MEEGEGSDDGVWGDETHFGEWVCWCMGGMCRRSIIVSAQNDFLAIGLGEVGPWFAPLGREVVALGVSLKVCRHDLVSEISDMGRTCLIPDLLNFGMGTFLES